MKNSNIKNEYDKEHLKETQERMKNLNKKSENRKDHLKGKRERMKIF